MSSRVQGFDTTLFRVVGTGVGEPGPLSADYLFGLGADPFNDNNFPMPSGNWRWPGSLDWGAGHLASAAAFFADRTKINFSSPPAVNLWSQPANISGIGGNGCGAFNELELNDPNWNGQFSQFGDFPWVAESILFSSDSGQTSAHSGIEYGRRQYRGGVGSPWVPGLPQIGDSLASDLSLWNATINGQNRVSLLSGYGSEERLLYAPQNGASAQWVTHWQNDALAPAAGDGPAWWIDVDGRFGRFLPAAGIQAYQRTGAAIDAWGWRLKATDAAFNLHDVLDVNTDGGTLNGATIATIDTATVTYRSAKLDFTVAQDNIPMGIPLRPGFLFVGRLITDLITDGAGIATGAALTVSTGNNATHDNVSIHNISAATINTLISIAPYPTFANAGGATSGLLDAGTQIVGRISTPASGVASLHGYMSVQGFWVPA